MNKRILRIVSVFLLSALTAAASSAYAQTLNYVRKKTQPSFFIPQKDLAENKPEKVGLPQYKRGKSTTKHISADDNQEEIMAEKQRRFQSAEKKWNTPAKQPDNNIETQPLQQQQPSSSVASLPEEKNNNGHDIPDYQMKYQEYLKDLETISQGGSLPNNPGIQDDLSAMNSEQRIEIDKNFNANRDIQSEVEELLK